MKKGWLIVNEFLHNAKFSELTELFIQAAKEQQIELSVVTNGEILVGNISAEQIENLDFILFWDKDVLLAKTLENMGLPVFNTGSAIEICDHKGKTYLALAKANLPVPVTILAPMTYENVGYSNLDFCQKAAKSLGFPMIVKEAYGSFGMQVYKVENEEELRKRCEELQGKDIVLQEYIATSCGRDLRLQVVGNQVVAAMERTSEIDFRANVTIGGKMRAYKPSPDECNLAVQAARAVGADFAGVDLLFGKNEMLVCEVNSNAHFKNILDCTGINTAVEIMRYIHESLDCI